MQRVIDLGTKRIGKGEPCFIIAEAGINHNGDMALAHRLIDAAADAGADAVKFQNYATEDFIADRAITYQYEADGKQIVESQYDMFKRYELPREALRPLCRHCEDRGVIFLSTPTNEQGIADLVGAGSPLLKNGSDFLGHLPLISAMARSGLPTILSTGMATLSDIDEAVRTYREQGGKDLILLVCTSKYPAPAEELNLRRIASMAQAFSCLIGLSDHSDGIYAAIAAAALGAHVLEKHFTLDRQLPGPDHCFSSTPSELAGLVQAIRQTELSLGSSSLLATPGAIASRRLHSLSCVAARDLPKGCLLSETDIVFRRPGTGFPPKDLTLLVGRTLKEPLRTGQVLRPDCLT